MIDTPRRITNMTLLKILATALAALTFTLLALPGFAANSNDGVTSPPSNPGDPAAKPRRHRKHQGQHRHQRRQNPDGSPQAPAPQQG
ncbi:MAG: hypothetical protein J0J01_09615 [Reyranella sp.]|uniref:hypothetical protein n=1 Tax=Reyranella sp. TaxID=1929291 RepID=UPI001ACED4ED|nr:hypothetical protein [Reyranella sp.]MBN9087154.1 hypothetical protein [Reyranella sp.]